MSTDERVKQFQARLNQFTSQFVDGLNPITEDGITGPATSARATRVKLFLGYTAPCRVSDERLLNAVTHVTALARRAGERGRVVTV